MQGDILAEPSESARAAGLIKPVPPFANDPYRPIESIVFPLFGTGAGGRSVPEIVPPMLEAFEEYLRGPGHDDACNLNCIVLCVYIADAVAVVHDILSNTFEPS